MRSVGVLGSFFFVESMKLPMSISPITMTFFTCEFFFNWWRFDVCSDVRCSACCECVCQCKIDLISLLQQTPSMRNIELILLLLLSSYLQLKRARMRDVFGWMDLFWFREAMNDVQTVIFCVSLHFSAGGLLPVFILSISDVRCFFYLYEFECHSKWCHLCSTIWGSIGKYF